MRRPPKDLSPGFLRRLLGDLFRTDEDFDRLCLEEFRDVYNRFAAGMDRVSKMNKLLATNDPPVIWEGVCSFFHDAPSVLERISALAAAPASGQPTIGELAPHFQISEIAKQRAPQPPGSPYDPAWYVHRDREQRLALAHLDTPGAPAVIWGPEKFGRTTLIKHLLSRCLQTDRENGKRSKAIEVNLERLDESSWQSFDRFLLNLAHAVGTSLELDEGDLAQAWTGAGTSRDKLNDWMELHVLDAIDGRLILAIDQADTVWKRKMFHDSFFGMLRGWAEDISDRWSRLRLLISVSTVPTLLVSATTQSPFNNAVTVKLGDFTHAQVAAAAAAYGLNWSDSQLSSLMEYIGGHPYLVRVALYNAACAGWAPTQFSQNIIEEFFGDHLARLEIQLHGEPDLLKVLCQISKNPSIRIPIEVGLRLTSLGLVLKEETGNYRIRYRIYEPWLRQICTGGR